MADKSKIEWLKDEGGIAGATWNPVTGCSPISAGCDHCYAARMANRQKAMGTRGYENGFAVTCHPERLSEPASWKKPRRIFVCSMGDLFHPDVPVDFLNRIFAAMRAAPQHTYMILTKRPKRLNELDETGEIDWPWELVWLGATVESPEHEGRIKTILEIDAAMHFVSIEPCLGDVSLTPYLYRKVMGGDGTGFDGQTLWYSHALDLVILGGETGPGARPMHPAWARSVRDQTKAAGKAFFFKSWGEWMPAGDIDICDPMLDVSVHSSRYYKLPDGRGMIRVGKTRSGRRLDGRKWNEFPKSHGG